MLVISFAAIKLFWHGQDGAEFVRVRKWLYF
jgi:hypothetical protein